MTTEPKKVHPPKKKPTHPWRGFNPGWLADNKKQKPHGAIL